VTSLPLLQLAADALDAAPVGGSEAQAAGHENDIEAVIACLGDDAASLRDQNAECEIAANMDVAAATIASLCKQLDSARATAAAPAAPLMSTAMQFTLIDAAKALQHAAQHSGPAVAAIYNARATEVFAVVSSVASSATVQAAPAVPAGEAMRQALEPFAKAAYRWDDPPGVITHDNVELWQNGKLVDYLTVGDLRRARAALSAQTAVQGEAQPNPLNDTQAELDAISREMDVIYGRLPGKESRERREALLLPLRDRCVEIGQRRYRIAAAGLRSAS
jgi:hypothetical protein